MFGAILIFVLAVMGGAIAFMGDKLGSKIGKKRLSVLGLRPHDTSVLITILTGIMVAAATMGALTAASQEVRTALFGMKQIRAEIAQLNQDKTEVSSQLASEREKVKALDEEIKKSSEELAAANKQKKAAEEQLAAAKAQLSTAQGELTALQDRYRAAEARLTAAQAKLTTVEASRTKLQGEVKDLETATKKLREGMVAIREGDVVFRSGEILYAAVLKAGLPKEQNQQQMEQFLAVANNHILDRLNARENTQALWVSKDLVNNALEALAKGKGDIYVRLCAAGNIISGEMVVSRFEMAPNKLIFAGGDILFKDRINVNTQSGQPSAALMAFLRDVNRTAVQAGVMPDPITGKVGAIDSNELEKITAEIIKLGGKVELTAKARRDITVAGPVLITIDVKNVGGNNDKL